MPMATPLLMMLVLVAGGMDGTVYRATVLLLTMAECKSTMAV